MNQVTKYAVVLSLVAAVLLSAVPCMADDARQSKSAPASKPARDHHPRAKTIQEAVASMSGIMGLVLAVAAGLSLLIVVQLLFPGLTSCGADALRKGLFRSFLLGLAVLVVLVLLVAGASAVAKPLGGALAVVLLSLLVLITFPMVSQDLGRRIFARSGTDRGPVAQLAIGWLVFVGASIAPILGWFIIFPFLTLAGIGALVQTFWTRKAETETPAAEVADG